MPWLSQRRVAGTVLCLREGLQTGCTAQNYLFLATLEKLQFTLLYLLEVTKQLHTMVSFDLYPLHQVIPGRHCLMQVEDGNSSG